MVREKLQRVVIECGETMADERRLAVREDGQNQLVTRDAPMKHMTAPPIGAKGNRNEIVGSTTRSWRGRIGAANAIASRRARSEARREQLGRPLRIVVEHESRHLVHEPPAIGNGIDVDQLSESCGAARNGHVF